MASFLNNKGDIILDAVLTDYGRRLLAKGDGSFNIVKFAFADDEIDYGLFNATASYAQQDIKIMQTPIMEAFTNNAASMKSQLMTMGDNKLLFMASLKLNNVLVGARPGEFKNSGKTVFSGFIIPIDESDQRTTNALKDNSPTPVVLEGVLTSDRFIAIDQGINTTKLSNTEELDMQLKETEYNIFVDSRFCSISLDYTSNTISPSSVDDDGIAVYKVSDESGFVSDITTSTINSAAFTNGPRGTRLRFFVKASQNLKTDAYFSKYGRVLSLNSYNSLSFNTIKMPIRIIGVKTGISLDIPVMFAKKI